MEEQFTIHSPKMLHLLHSNIINSIARCLFLICCISFAECINAQERQMEEDGFVWYLINNNKYVGAISASGDTIIPISRQYHSLDYRPNQKEFIVWKKDNAKPFSDGHTGLGLKGICNLEGKEIIPPIFYEIKHNDKYYEVCYKTSKKQGYFNNGLQGVYDNNGKEIIPPIYYKVKYKERPDRGYFIVELEDKKGCGILDVFGRTVVEPNKIYKTILSMDDPGGPNYFFYSKGSKYPHIDAELPMAKLPKRGEPSLSLEEYLKKSTLTYQGDYGINVTNGKYQLVNDSDRVMTERLYDYIGFLPEDSIYMAKIGNISTVLDMRGKEIASILSEMYSVALETEDVSDQIEIYHTMINLDDENKEGYKSLAYYNLGTVYESTGDTYTARKMYSACRRCDRNNQLAQESIERVDAQRKAEEKQLRAERLRKIADALAGINNALENYNNFRQSQQSLKSVSSSKNTQPTANIDSRNSKGNAVSKSVNERQARYAYNENVTLLIDMNTFRDRYNDSQRRNIQNSMRHIRQQWGFPKSEWEDWNGVKK